MTTPAIIIFRKADAQYAGQLRLGLRNTFTLAWAWAADASSINAVMQLPQGDIGFAKGLPASTLIGSHHAVFIPLPPAIALCRYFTLPQGSDIIICFRHTVAGCCTVYCYDGEQTVLPIWERAYWSWAQGPRPAPHLLLGKGSLAFTIPPCRLGQHTQLVILDPWHAARHPWKQQLCQRSFSSEPHKAMSPCTKYLVVYTGTELHLMSFITGFEIASWGMARLAGKLQPSLLSDDAPAVSWAMNGWQIWLRNFAYKGRQWIVMPGHRGYILQFDLEAGAQRR